MSQQPFTPAALRGAVDLSVLRRSAGGRGAGMPSTPAPGGAPQSGPAAGGAGGYASGGAVPGRAGALVHASDATFESVVNASMGTPIVLVLWTPQLPESVQHLNDLVGLVADKDGRFQVVGVDLGENPGIMQALTPILQQSFGQVTALPVVMGLMGGQPMPFYLGVQDLAQVGQLLDTFLQAAVTNGVTGRVTLDGVGSEGEDGEGEEAAELPPLHQQAYDAIDAGDWAGAISAYEQALAQDPSDEMARLGLGQVRLLERTSSLDLAAVRAAAAADPKDVDAQIAAADVDLVGGHVEDGFLRLVDTVRVTSGDDRDRARTHLLELFDVIGAHDPRVQKARGSLMSALF
ncbi:tetratricopeptide repeat protein [Ornithinimicrobium tianjinense]|uniref:Co-chaperone YbbN n=1 Tax=Ornithinimicrobium tianjinense TaxID=1195761 RepID=A0A917BFG2_9MICO|nr:tetratricopeptide repeat protein [Ornithinimicrobium tianjinense]GGF41488.1 co-chaperone YbbN [Ornithinimicrobium tianjinense]